MGKVACHLTKRKSDGYTPSQYAAPLSAIVDAVNYGVSANLDDPRGFDDGRLSLPFSEFSRLFAVGIDAGEPVPVLVKQSSLPVPVLAPAILPELRAFSCGLGFGHGLTISIGIRTRKYQFRQ